MPRAHVAAIDATTGQLLPLDVNVSSPVGAIAAEGDSLYLGGVFSSVDGQTRKNIAEVDASSGVVSAWHPSMSARVRASGLGRQGHHRVMAGTVKVKVKDGWLVYDGQQQRNGGESFDVPADVAAEWVAAGWAELVKAPAGKRTAAK